MQVLEETAVTSAENCTDDVVEAPVSRVQVEKRDGVVRNSSHMCNERIC